MAFNILIVDDSTPMRAVIKKVIKASGFDFGELIEACNGEEALEVLGKCWLDLVITDFNMPDMDGLEMLKEMKRHDTMKDIPVVVVTSEGSDMRIQEFLAQGASAYVQKPFTPEKIKAELSQILGESANEPSDDAECDGALDF